MRDGLPCIDMRIPMDAKMDNCPHTFLTADSHWDPLVLDNEFDEEFYKAVMKLPEVKERHDRADPCIDGYRFPQTCEDYKLLFRAQD